MSVLKKLLGVGFVALSLLWVVDQSYQSQPLPLTTPTTVVIAPGQSLQHFLSSCQKKGQCQQARWWYWRIRFLGQTIKSGEYRFLPGDTHRTWLSRIINGHEILYPVTFIPGHDIRMAWSLGCEQKAVRCQTPLTTDSAEHLRQTLGWPHLEGQILPETYHVPKDTDMLSIMTIAHKALEQVLDETWREADDLVKAQLKTSQALLILASIIEKETGYDLEKPYIAGVLLGRLADNMRLQVDPTRSYDPLPPWQSTDYDTYRIFRLPPTPIALVSQSSLQAAAHPKSTSARYYVATRAGYHIFSQTYEAHQKAIEQYR